MSEPIPEQSSGNFIDSAAFKSFLSSPKDTKFKGIIDLAGGFPTPSDEISVTDTALMLLRKDVTRIPIIAIKKGNETNIFGLVTNNGRQEHKALLSDLQEKGYSVNDILFTTSIECGEAGQYTATFESAPKVGGAVSSPDHLSLGKGSDLHEPKLPPFTSEGRKMMEKVLGGRISMSY
ncbi:MAG TPA: hypothetical protein VF185_03665 [Patescibacteria group bacterium]